MWENGERILQRSYQERELRGREYVFEIIRRSAKPFMDMRPVKTTNDTWTVFYSAEGCMDFDSMLQINCRHGKLSLSFFLDLMEKLLTAIDLAEDKMILSSSFLINGSTIWYHGQKKEIRIMYVPTEKDWKDGDNWLWKSMPTVKILFGLLEESSVIDPGFRQRWSFLEESLLKWETAGWGRCHCMAQIRKWKKEYPQGYEIEK